MSAPSLLLLRAGARWLALPAAVVREVALRGFVTRVPREPPHVLGVTLLRGRVVPVVSLEAFLGSRGEPAGAVVPTLPRLVVIEAAGEEVALAADEVDGIVELPAEPAPAQSPVAELRDHSGRPGYVTTEIFFRDRLLTVLDAAALVTAALGLAQAAALGAPP